MKRISLWILPGLLLVASCSRGSGTPSATVEAFLGAARTGDADFFRYLQEKDRAFLEEMRKTGGDEKYFRAEKDTQHTIVDETIAGDTAAVTVETVREGIKSTQTMKLVREGGSWKIDLVPDTALEAMKAFRGFSDKLKKKASAAASEDATETER